MPDIQVDLQEWKRADGARLPVHVTRFDSASFLPDHCAAAGIDCPPGFMNMVRKRQAEYFHGRLCARAALLHIGVPPLPVGSGPMREPLWPHAVVGSITHSRTAAAAIALPASRYRGVGIDIEEVADPGAQEALRAMVVSRKEIALLEAAGGEAGLSLSAVFSAKESFYKAAFGTVGRYFDFGALELARFDWEARTMSFTVRQSLGGDLQPGYPVRIAFSRLAHGEVATLYAW